MFFFESLRPVEWTMAIQMLDGRFVTWAPDAADMSLHSPAAVRANRELPSQTDLNFSWDLKLIRHVFS